MSQTQCSVKLFTHYKTIPLNSLRNSARYYMICPKKGNTSTLTKEVLFFKDFKALKNQ